MDQVSMATTFRCCAVIVTYHPPADLAEAVRRLAGQVDSVVVVDNASGEEYAPQLESIASMERCTLVRGSRNLGIAAGFNAGVRLALEAGYDWVATFDQDSRIPAGYFDALLATLHAHPDPSRVALLAPRLKDPVTGLHGSHGSGLCGVPYEEVPVTISSGCLLRSSVFGKVGLFDEALFMDYVDHEFCLRLRGAGYLLLESTLAVLEHRIGATSRHAILGRPVKVTNHSPLRRYYMTRNRLVLYRRYGTRFASWALNDFCCMLKELAGVILFEQEKTEKVRMMLLGMFHGVMGRLGPLQGDAPANEGSRS